jgi:hypothetical protein
MTEEDTKIEKKLAAAELARAHDFTYKVYVVSTVVPLLAVIITLFNAGVAPIIAGVTAAAYAGLAVYIKKKRDYLVKTYGLNQ